MSCAHFTPKTCGLIRTAVKHGWYNIYIEYIQILHKMLHSINKKLFYVEILMVTLIKQIILKLKVQFRNKKCYQGQSIVFIIGEKKTYWKVQILEYKDVENKISPTYLIFAVSNNVHHKVLFLLIFQCYVIVCVWVDKSHH
jgi:hypothetical protein